MKFYAKDRVRKKNGSLPGTIRANTEYTGDTNGTPDPIVNHCIVTFDDGNTIVVAEEDLEPI